MFGYVFYPDGGCHPQHGFSGAGIHGYRWNLLLPAKGIGHTTHAPTIKGYELKADTINLSNKEIKAHLEGKDKAMVQEWLLRDDQASTYRIPVERYYDSFIPLEYGGTNNTAELFATIHCLERIVGEEDFSQACLLVIRQDAQYVVDGFNVYLPKWLEKNFTRKDGTFVSNQELWLRLHQAAQKIKALGVEIVFEWVKGHGTSPGNLAADILATAGKISARSPSTVESLDTSFRISEVTDYWSTRSELRHPMLNHRYAFFSIDEAEKERTVYYLTSQGKIADLVGKRTSEDGYAVVRCAAQPHIEEIISKQITLPREIDYRFHLDLDNLYGAAGRYLDLYGSDFLHRALDHKRHLQTYGKELLTTELHPPYLVDRIFDNMDILSDFLESYKKDDNPSLLTTEITNDFFNYTEETVKVKKGETPYTKTVCALKPEFVVGYAKHKVQARWKDSDGEIKECDLILRLGIDLPERNALRRLEERNPKVYLVTNTLGAGSFMYAVVIEAEEDVGIWSGMNSSIRVVANTASKTQKD